MPVNEISGAFRDVLVVTEFKGAYPNVPIAVDVDYAALIAGDDDPMFLTLPIGKANVTSGNKRHYDEAFLQELERQTIANKPVGLMGHLSDAERGTSFPPEAIHWVGAVRDGDTLWGKGYIPRGPVRERIAKYRATKKSIATSIDAFADGVWDESIKAHRMTAATLRLNQIDIAPADRAGIPDLAAVPHLTSEFAPASAAGIGASGTSSSADTGEMAAPVEDTQQEPITMADKQEVLQELRKAAVAPTGMWTPPSQPAEAPELTAIRETLGADDKADLTKLVKELQERVQEQEKAAVKSRITELAATVKLEDVRSVVVEMVEAKKPRTVQEAEAAYAQVVEMQSIKNLSETTVQRVMGPPQGTPLQRQHGANKYFQIPSEGEKERA